MTAPRLEALTRYWRINPPTHLLMKAFTGYKAPTDIGGKTGGPPSIEEFFKRLPKVVQSDEGLAGLMAQEGLVKRGF